MQIIYFYLKSLYQHLYIYFAQSSKEFNNFSAVKVSVISTKNMSSADIESIIKEGKEFCRLKRAYENARFPDAGTPAYIISIDWLAKYKAYCFYEEIKFNQSPAPDEDHVAEKHPGPITNAELLHPDAKFLKGTGTLNGFESEVMDTYLHEAVRERINFEFVNEEIFVFLKDKYGCD